MFQLTRGQAAAAVLVIALFLAAGYFANTYTEELIELLSARGIIGQLVYVFGATVATVIAPLSFLPALPIAVAMWGSFTAAVLSVAAWTLGAVIAFALARRWGRPLVLRFVDAEKMARFERLLPARHAFWAVVVLRFVAPVDILSYLLGVFVILPFWRYLAATVIGITPFAFVFAYLSEFSLFLQAAVLLLGLGFAALSYPYLRRNYRRVFIEESEDGVKN